MASNIYVRHSGYKNSTRLKQRIIFAVFVSISLLFISRFYVLSAPLSHSVSYQPVTVQAGDTLWQLASQTGLSEDTRTLVLQIMNYNGLVDSNIHPGQTLYLPMSLTSASTEKPHTNF